ncbi:MAG: hypothetical protein JWM07_233 [Candidatus Saccharibacteria bacterium]|nr:hypothetical protein [Candidatus Saccharibacteria bacterium]
MLEWWYFKSNMYETGTPFSNHSYLDNDELALKRAAKQLQAANEATLLTTPENELRTSLGEKFAQPADATVRSIGDLAIQSFTGGILQATFDTDKSKEHESTSVTPERARAFGDVSLRDYMLRDASSLTVTDANILGYAEKQIA